jgi:hypothetical protein
MGTSSIVIPNDPSLVLNDASELTYIAGNFDWYEFADELPKYGKTPSEARFSITVSFIPNQDSSGNNPGMILFLRHKDGTVVSYQKSVANRGVKLQFNPDFWTAVATGKTSDGQTTTFFTVTAQPLAVDMKRTSYFHATNLEWTDYNSQPIEQLFGQIQEAPDDAIYGATVNGWWDDVSNKIRKMQKVATQLNIELPDEWKVNGVLTDPIEWLTTTYSPQRDVIKEMGTLATNTAEAFSSF